MYIITYGAATAVQTAVKGKWEVYSAMVVCCVWSLLWLEQQ